MDAEDVHRLLTQTRLRCLLLEADKDIEILRAEKYRKIIGSLAGEDGATQPQAPGIFQMPRHALEPHRGSTSTSGSQPGSNLSSHESPAQSISTRCRPSFDMNDIPPESSRISTSDPGSESDLRSGSPTTMPGDIPGFPAVDVVEVSKRAGLTPLELTSAMATRVEETPGIGWATFSKVFGGRRRSEWPQGFRFSGYSDFFCADVIVQPFVPHAAGKPGLLLRFPTVIESPETEKSTFHVLSNTLQGGALYYRGKYTRVPVPEKKFDWSSDLPKDFQDRWFKRVSAAQPGSPAIRALCARINFRNKHGREPSAMEVHAQLQHFNKVTHKEVAVAFKSGKEKLVLEGLRCTGYDSHLSKIIQRVQLEANDD